MDINTQDPIRIFCKELIPDIIAYHRLPIHANTPIPPKREFSITMANDELCRYEEYGTLWFWAYPKLLLWSYDVCWLFSPVVGNDKFPGDLWGVDSQGNLIIIETKLSRHRKRQDPFSDFINFDQWFLQPAIIQQHWQMLFAAEKSFSNTYSNLLERGQTVRQKLPGVVPYSDTRFAIWRWRHLYLHVIMPQLCDINYEDRAKAYLGLYAAKATPQPYYFGVILVAPDVRPSLSRKGHDNYRKLCEQVTEGHVHLRSLSSSYMDNDVVQLEGRIVQTE